MRLPGGLAVLEGYITEEEEKRLIEEIDACPWGGNGAPPNPELLRRTQHYGYLFSYRFRKTVENLGPLPHMFSPVLSRLVSDGHFPTHQPPNSVIVNEYLQGQGIKAHKDSSEQFGEVVTSLSLLSACVISFFSMEREDEEPHRVLLPRRSLLVMSGVARHKYKHEISKELVEFVDGVDIVRGRRVSLTFRTVINQNSQS
ncbi:hypothetical protein BJ742DRAFT_40435 [Cladochytrium replicatum]|nr:hypothetical protein BJ742DRAFT_40435 [Cladochytrium replicatum]